MILTTRTLSTLKFFGFGGMTVRAASATREERVSSKPYCLEAIEGLSARASGEWVGGDESVAVESSVKIID